MKLAVRRLGQRLQRVGEGTENQTPITPATTNDVEAATGCGTEPGSRYSGFAGVAAGKLRGRCSSSWCLRALERDAGAPRSRNRQAWDVPRGEA